MAASQLRTERGHKTRMLLLECRQLLLRRCRRRLRRRRFGRRRLQLRAQLTNLLLCRRELRKHRRRLRLRLGLSRLTRRSCLLETLRKLRLQGLTLLRQRRRHGLLALLARMLKLLRCCTQLSLCLAQLRLQRLHLLRQRRVVNGRVRRSRMAQLRRLYLLQGLAQVSRERVALALRRLERGVDERRVRRYHRRVPPRQLGEQRRHRAAWLPRARCAPFQQCGPRVFVEQSRAHLHRILAAEKKLQLLVEP
mmetsp:Transcript_59006/g.128105  ORF Transcript_59006/g.128105 Transcript_59006/m.128105 type:complete len:251 (-) Transcript_59006:596-1348(-)